MGDLFPKMKKLLLNFKQAKHCKNTKIGSSNQNDVARNGAVFIIRQYKNTFFVK